MRRLLCVLLMLSMVFTMCTTASAETIAEGTSYVPNPMSLELTVDVGAREADTDNDYFEPLNSIEVGEGEKKYVDYIAILDMGLIRDLFKEGFIQSALPNDAQATAEYENGIVSTTVNVVIEYPSKAIVDRNVSLTSRNIGVLDAGSIFRESNREVSGNALKITYVNESNLTVKRLHENVDTYLKDISFTIEDTFAYAEEGSYTVKLTLSGETVIDFASKDQVVNYSGTASNVVNVVRNGEVSRHALEVVPAVAATCSEPGWTEGIICRTHNSYDCGALGTDEPQGLPALNHKNGNTTLKIRVDAVAATCTSKGMIEHWTCTLCKNDFDSADSDVIKDHESYVTAKLPHTEVEIPAIAADCTKVGLTAGKKCSVCNTVTVPQTTVPALGHSRVTLPAVPATCTEAGKTEGIECSVCHTVLAAQAVVPATGHNFGVWNVTIEATETSTGLMERVCLNGCGTKEEREIEKKPHTCVADESLTAVTTAPTCTEKGSKQNYCSCGKAVGEAIEIPATGHTTSAVAEVKATCVTEGSVAHYICVVCNLNFRDQAGTKALASIKEPIDKNNHGDNIITIPGIASTCTTQGLSSGEKCKNCNVITKSQTLLPVAPHTLVDIPAKDATCDQHGMKAHKHCKICNKDFDMTGTVEWTTHDFDIPVLGHNYGEAVKFPEVQDPVDGHYDGIKTCLNGCGATLAVKIAVTPETCTHPITLDVITKEATCEETGVKENVCLSCARVETSDIPMAAHALERIEAVQPTCHAEGIGAYYVCSYCDKMFDGTDLTVEITETPVLAKTTHIFREIGGGNNKQCIICHEVVHVKKNDKHGNPDNSDNITVNNMNVGVKKHDDKVKEEAYANINENIDIKSEIIINEREEVSEEIDTAISNTAASENAVVNKAVWDMDVEKITTYSSGEVDKESIKELDDLIEITIKIPEALRSSIDFLVYRSHITETGAQETHVIRTTPNEAGEYIKIDLTAGTVTLKVKKFSEYALVGYSTVVNTQSQGSTRPSTGGAGTTNTFTVKFNANGGTVVESIKVASGKTITEPATRRDGYTFDGWYTDAEYTEKFDFTQPITYNVTLYAKWTEIGATDEHECVALKFKDVDPELWYHLGIDYVVENGLMLGVEEDEFAPDANITRGMFVTVLGRIEEVGETVTIDEAFADVSDTEYYANYINWAVKNGIVYGYGEGLFGPEDFITREQIAGILYRYAKLKGYDVSVGENTNILSYDDYSSISEYAIPSVQYAVGSGLMKGKSETTFNPADNSTRAEIATILYRFIEANK